MTDRALLCVAGADAKVKVYNIREAKLFTVSARTVANHPREQ